MADQTVPTAGHLPDFSVYRGERAFKELIRDIFTSTEADLGAFSDAGGAEGVDARNYKQVASIMHQSIIANVIDADDGVREGFLRALADILCHTADEMGGGSHLEDWRPLRVTEAAFAGSLGQMRQGL